MYRKKLLAFGAVLPVFWGALHTDTFAQTKPAPTAGAAAVSSEPSNTTATYGDWQLRCVALSGSAEQKSAAKTSHQACEIVQAVQVQGQQQPIAEIAIGHLPEQKQLTVTAVVAGNISLPGLLHISGNGKDGTDEKGGVDLAWQKCFAGTCAGNAKLDDAALNDWRNAPAGQLRVKDAAGRIVAIPLSWKGLATALTALNMKE